MMNQKNDIFKTQTLRQIVGDQLDNCYVVLKSYIEHSIQNEYLGDDVNIINKDLLGALNFFIQKYELIQSITQIESKFLKNLLFELKHYRNNWAHSKDFTLRELYSYRITDSILMVFDELSLNINTEQYQRTSYIRQCAIMKMSQQILSGQGQNF